MVKISYPADTLMNIIQSYYLLFFLGYVGLFAMLMYQRQDDNPCLVALLTAFLALFLLSLILCTELKAEFVIQQSVQTGRTLVDEARQLSKCSLVPMLRILGGAFLSTILSIGVLASAESHPHIFQLATHIFGLLSVVVMIFTASLLIVLVVFKLRRRSVAGRRICIGRLAHISDEIIYCSVREAPSYCRHLAVQGSHEYDLEE